ncbi:MAG: hypothetical protein C4532_15270 [Candidatus Abyssobacteria bacterium SURF_17]|uniref:Glycoside hydrolase family 38 central domain-containing protein n=1 Tax=Candidatus Abyssobacteria bacterium SURF_17 TaxID=2093361 RepID=A0A419ET37_9BACT|nr:MAG: hypothetical protein C4532_15270 [Candidatus Abyssubacteria bacterium SURF_17]
MGKHLVVVPHTHWDREWYMPFELFRKRLVSMMDHLLEIMQKDRKFKYFELDGQTIVLLDYLAVRPENEPRLRRFIEAGRILIGPWYVQPDEFLVSGEALIRNLRKGIKLAKEFGKPSMIGYMPDQFGHIAQMPQILAQFGIRSAIVWRGVGDTVGQTQFLWESPDGTRIFTIYLADSYSSAAFLPLKPAVLKQRLNELIKRQEQYCNIESMLIMNGLDHLEPQDGLASQLDKAVSGMAGVTCEMGNFGIFIAQAQKQAQTLSVHRGEFRSSKRVPLIPGVTSARVRQKQQDFVNSRLLEKYVEPLCTWATLCGDTRPHRDFVDYAWRLTLENHPHDSICGCSVDPVHEEMETRFEKVRQVGEILRDDALSFLAGRLDTAWMEADAPALCVYNPTSLAGQVVDVIVDVEEPDFVNSLRDRRGKPTPVQKTIGERELFLGAQESPAMIREQVAGMEGRELLGYYINNILWQREGNVLKLNLIMGRAPAGEADVQKRRDELLLALSDPSIELVDIKGVSGAKTRLSFFAANLSPTGLNAFLLSPERAAEDNERTLRVAPDELENDFYRVRINEDGTLDIHDKASGAAFRRCLRFVDEGDRGDSYNFDEVSGGEVIDKPSGKAHVSVVEDGPVRATVQIDVSLRIPDKLSPARDARSTNYIDTPIATLVSIYRDIKRIDFRTTFDNQCEDHRLRALFSAPFEASEVNVESAFCVVKRSCIVEPGEGHFEKPTGAGPQKTFSCIENGSVGMALFNRGIPEIEAAADKDGTSLALTLVRSIGWLSRDDMVVRPAAAGPQLAVPGAQAKGPHTFEYAFTSYQGSYTEANIVAHAHAYAFPPIAIITNRHKGSIRGGTSLAVVDNPNIVVSAVEASRLKGAYVARLYNATGSPQETRFLPVRKSAILYEVDFLEKRRSNETLQRAKGGVKLSFRPSEIKTLQIVPKR